MRADLLPSGVLLFGAICLLDDALPAKYNLQFGGTLTPIIIMPPLMKV